MMPQVNGLKAIGVYVAIGTILSTFLAGGYWLGKIDERQYAHVQLDAHPGAEKRMTAIEKDLIAIRGAAAQAARQAESNGKKLDRLLQRNDQTFPPH